jgi:hypothetical protein
MQWNGNVVYPQLVIQDRNGLSYEVPSTTTINMKLRHINSRQLLLNEEPQKVRILGAH